LWPFPRKTGTATDNVVTALVDALRKDGFVEGQNLTIDYRAWASHAELTSDYAAEMVKAGSDVITALEKEMVRHAGGGGIVHRRRC